MLKLDGTFNQVERTFLFFQTDNQHFHFYIVVSPRLQLVTGPGETDVIDIRNQLIVLFPRTKSLAWVRMSASQKFPYSEQIRKFTGSITRNMPFDLYAYNGDRQTLVKVNWVFDRTRDDFVATCPRDDARRLIEVLKVFATYEVVIATANPVQLIELKSHFCALMLEVEHTIEDLIPGAEITDAVTAEFTEI